MQGVGTGRLVASRYALRQRRATLGAIEVWAATDSTLGREVSVTVLPVSDSHATPLLDAARQTAAVNDHRLVRVLDVGSRGDVAWIVEESLSESTSIADLLSSGPLPPEEARRICGEVASALQVAGRAGLHHLHITPHAVRRTKAGLIKIAGLGTAAAVEGTPVPDEVEAQRIDALGTMALLYAAMTTRWPLRTNVPGLEPAPRVAGHVVPPSEIAVAIPPDLDALCRAAFSRSSAPRSPEEVAQRLGPWSHTLVRHVAPRAAAAATERIPRVGAPSTTPSDGGSPSRSTSTATSTSTTSAPATARTSVGAAPSTGRRPSHREQRAHERAAQAAEERRDIAARRRDPGFLDVPQALAASSGPLDPPAPLVSVPEREGRYAKTVLAVVGAILLLATLVAGLSLFGALREVSSAVTPQKKAASSTPSAAPGSSGPASAPASAAASGITFTDAIPLDPGGDGRENGAGAGRAHDGDPNTHWRSERYKAADYQGQKDGVGLALRLPRDADPSQLTVTLGERSQSGAVYVSDRQSIEGATEVASFTDATGAQQMSIPEQARSNARYVIVWVTQAMSEGDGQYRAIVSEVTAG